MKRLRIGVLGVSNHLKKRIVLPLQKTVNCELYAIASRSEEKAKKAAEKFNIAVSYSSYEALIEDVNVDAVYIPLPNHKHCEWIKKCADNNKPVLCEKPMGLNSAEVKDIFEYATTKKVRVMEAFMYKFHPLWQYVKDILETGQIGTIRYVNTLFSYNNPDKANIRNVKQYGGGALYDIGCYAISASRFLMGEEPKRVVSTIKFDDNTNTDTLSSAILDFKDKQATFTVCTLSEAKQVVEIIASSGSITIPVPFNTYVDVPSEIIITTAQGQRTVKFDVTNQYGLMFDAFANAILNDKPLPVDSSDTINNMTVLDALFESSNMNKWVDID